MELTYQLTPMLRTLRTAIPHWYHAQGQAIAGEVSARIAMVRNVLVRNRTDGPVVRLISPTYGSDRETSERLVAYVQAMYSILGNDLPD